MAGICIGWQCTASPRLSTASSKFMIVEKDKCSIHNRFWAITKSHGRGVALVKSNAVLHMTPHSKTWLPAGKALHLIWSD
jgi:hypothetical protein